MFYKHWKKLSLALTAFFWASCENTTTEPPLYGVPPQYSSSSETPESSAAKPSSSETTAESSSSREAVSSSSQSQSSSSDFTQVMPAYGVYDKVSCYLDDKDKEIKASTSSRGVFEYSYHCENGVNCVARDSVTGYEPEYPCKEDSITKQMICLDYGVIATTETTISCDDGKTYSEEEFRKQYNRLYTIKNNQEESSSSVAESSSSAEVTCAPNLAGDFFSVNKTDRYTESNAQSDAKQQVKFDAYRKIKTITEDSTISKEAKACLENESDSLEYLFVAAYGSPYANRRPKELKCSDGTTRLSEEYLEQQKFDEEQAKKKPQYDAKYAEAYEEEMKKFDQKIDECQKSGKQ